MQDLFTSQYFSQSKQFLHKFHNDKLVSNSVYLMASMFEMAFLGFFFWTICAHLYTPAQIGIATTFISVVSLLTTIGMLGLGPAVIRYLPSATNKSQFINTVSAVLSLSILIISGIFLLGVDVFSPTLSFFLSSPLMVILFLIFMVVAMINSITDSFFLSYRRTELTFGINTVMSIVKLILPLALVFAGTMGILYSYMISVTVAMVLSEVALVWFFKYVPRVEMNRSIVKTIWKFSGVNYISSLLGMLPSSITPILITNTLGPTITAYYFMPSMIIQLVLSVPRSISSSLFSEGVHDDNASLRKLFFRSLKTIYTFLIPATIGCIVLGRIVLSVFGKNYADSGYVYLIYVIISVNISAPNYLFTQVFNIRKKMNLIIIQSVLSCIYSLGALLVMLRLSLLGIGMAAILSAILLLISNIILTFIFVK